MTEFVAEVVKMGLCLNIGYNIDEYYTELTQDDKNDPYKIEIADCRFLSLF